MFSFNVSYLNKFGSDWHNETEESQIKDFSWQHNPLSLPPLSDQPFDILNVIKAETQQVPQAPESITTSVISGQDHLTEMDYGQEDAWTLNLPTPTTFNTLSWDTHNKHFPSFPQSQLAKKSIGTPFLTEAPASVFEPVIQSCSSGQPIYESDLVKSIIQVLVGSPSIHFYWHKNEFQLRKANIRLLGLSAAAIQPVIKELLSFATLLKKLEKVAMVCKTTNRYGLTGVAMGCCLAEFHVNMQQQIISLFENDEDVTILKVHQYVNNLAEITEKLCRLLCISVNPEKLTSEQNDHITQHGFFIAFGVDIINLLHKEVRQYDLVQSGNQAFYRDICLSMLGYVSVPFLSMLSKWLGLQSEYNGVYDDPYDEFFITTDMAYENILKRFDIRADAKLPYFISEELAVYILRSGLSLQLLRRTTPTHPIFQLKEAIPLKFLLENIDSDRYMSRIHDTCKYIQAYNLGNVLLEDPPIGVMIESLEEEYDTPMHDDTPLKLTFLDANLDLKGDFLKTLIDLLQHKQSSENFIPTVDTITEQSYIQPLQLWCPLLNESFMSSFLHQFKLQSHLLLLRDHFLFGSANFVIGLENTFFKTGISLSHHRRWPPRSYDLNMALRDLLLQDNDQGVFTFLIREAKDSSVWLNPNAVGALDFLQLNYHATYPLNIVITPPIIEKYNRIFTFVLQLLRTHTVTKRMYVPLKNIKWYRPGTRDTISRFRSGLEQFVSAMQCYVHDTAIHHTWFKFMQHVKGMQTNKQDDYVSAIMEPHTFKEYHEHILDRILYQCFLKRSQLQVLHELYLVLNDIIIFGKVLDDYVETDVNAEDKLFLKCRRLFEQFQSHAHIFVRILRSIEEKGYGRLGSLLNSTQRSIFNDLYAKHEAKNELDLFVKDLLIRLSLNGFYTNEQ